MNRLNFIITALIAVLLLCNPVFADNNSLTINSENYRASFAIYKVADSELNETADFASLNMDYTAVETAEDMDNAADTVLDYIGTNSIEPLNSLSAEDSVTFDNLESGLYFVRFISYDEDITMSSFLIMLPYYDSVSDAYLSDAVVNAKVYIDGGGGGGGTGGGGSEDPPGDTYPIPSDGDPSDKAEVRLEPTPEDKIPNESFDDKDITSQSNSDEDEVIPPYEEPTTEVATQGETTVTASEQITAASVPNGTLPQTGGDKTVILCYYAGTVAVFMGVIILFINNKKFRRGVN